MTISVLKSFAKVLFLTLFILIAIFVVVSYLLVLVMGYEFMFSTPQGLALSMQSFNFPVLLFFWIGFYTPVIRAGLVFQLVWIVYILCFIAAWKWRKSLHRVILRSFSQPFRSVFDNFLLIMPLISSMLFTAFVAIYYFQESIGIQTGQLLFPENTPLQEIFLNAAFMALIEELGFRLVPMGLFTIFYVFMAEKTIVNKRIKLLITALFYPEGAKKMAGLRNVSEHGIWRGINVGEWAMILITSVIFGFAHLVFGSGWQVGKITSAFLVGFFLALTYLAYGFGAPILLHWFFNYYYFFFDPDVAMTFFPSTIPILSLTFLVILTLGVLGWIGFAVVGLGKLLRMTRTRHEAPAAMLSS